MRWSIVARKRRWPCGAGARSLKEHPARPNGETVNRIPQATDVIDDRH